MVNVTDIQIETTIGKSVEVNGEKLGGVKAVVFNYDISDAMAIATLTMHIKKGSVEITDDKIAFNTPGFRGSEEEDDLQ